MADARIHITADAAQAQATMRTLGESVTGVSRRLMDMSGLAGTLGGALSITAFATFLKNTVDGVDALNDLADATGASIEMLSGLEGRAARTGTSMDTAGTALVKFNQLLNDAKPGSEAELSLKRLGLNFKELKRMDPAEALRQYAVALSGFADDGEKARLVQEQLGKSMREIAPFLKDLAEGGALVAKVTAQQAAEAEKFNKELFQLKANITDVSRSLTSDLVSSINTAITKFREGQAAGKGFFATASGVYWGNIRKFYGMEDKQEEKPEGSWGTDEGPMGPPAPAKGPRKSVGARADPAALKKAADLAAKIRADDTAAWQKYYDDQQAMANAFSEAKGKDILKRQEDEKKLIDSLLGSFNAGNQAMAETVAQQDLTEEERIQYKADAEMARLEERRILLQEQNAWTLAQEEQFEQARLNIKAQADSAFLKLDQANAVRRQQILTGSLATISSLMSSGNETLFRIGQISSIANATISTIEGATKALSLGPIIGPPLAAGIYLAGAANVAQIAETKIGGGTPSPVNATFSGGSVATGTMPSPITALPAPNANIEPARQQVSITVEGGYPNLYAHVVEDLAPKLVEAIGNGAIDLKISYS